jgi:Uma2 family endonuclease
MTQTKQRFLSFEDYLAFDVGTDHLYELFNGELIEVPPESGRNVVIVNFLFLFFAQIVDFRQIRTHGLELEVRGEPRNRFPDLTIIREEHIPQLEGRNTLRLTMAPPLLVVEVVSPGELQRERDYIAKRQQYQDVGIPEYWLVDPELQTITVLVLQDGVYLEAGTFQGSNAILSPTFGPLALTANQIFSLDQPKE